MYLEELLSVTMKRLMHKQQHHFKLHGYTVHQIMLNTFYYQLMHTTLKYVELLKHSKINTLYTLTQCTTHTPYRSQYAAIALTMPCTSFTHLLLTKRVTFSQVLTLAP